MVAGNIGIFSKCEILLGLSRYRSKYRNRKADSSDDSDEDSSSGSEPVAEADIAETVKRQRTELPAPCARCAERIDSMGAVYKRLKRQASGLKDVKRQLSAAQQEVLNLRAQLE